MWNYLEGKVVLLRTTVIEGRVSVDLPESAKINVRKTQEERVPPHPPQIHRKSNRLSTPVAPDNPCPVSQVTAYCLLVPKRSRVIQTTSISSHASFSLLLYVFLSLTFCVCLSLPMSEGGTKRDRKGGGMKLEKKILKERESDQTGEIRSEGGKRRMEGWWREGGTFRGDVCIRLQAASSYANTANFPFYFISGAEICDL